MASNDTFEGGCTCRHVRYRVKSRPMFVHCCHCTWCQRETGSAFALNAMIEADRIELIAGEVEVAHATEQGVSPGTSLVHYAPDVPATMVPSARLGAFLGSLQSPAAVLALPDTDVRAPHVAIRMQPDAEGYARMLYAGLREAEATGLSQIVIEEPAGREGMWLAVLDRLRRATVR